MFEQVSDGDPYISVCGICCSLCPSHRSGACPGCLKLENCRILQCAGSKETRYCFICDRFPCTLFEDGFDWDLNEFPEFRRFNVGTVRWKPYGDEYIRMFRTMKKARNG